MEDKEMEEQIKCKDWIICIDDIPEKMFGYTLENAEKEVMNHISIREMDKDECEI